LRKDISNITDFFKKREVKVLSLFELFQFITSADLVIDMTHNESESSKNEEISSCPQSITINKGNILPNAIVDINEDGLMQKMLLRKLSQLLSFAEDNEDEDEDRIDEEEINIDGSTEGSHLAKNKDLRSESQKIEESIFMQVFTLLHKLC
jgi:serine/threonine-protein kinase RIO1